MKRRGRLGRTFELFRLLSEIQSSLSDGFRDIELGEAFGLSLLEVDGLEEKERRRKEGKEAQHLSISKEEGTEGLS